MGQGSQRQLATFQQDAVKSETTETGFAGETSSLTFCVVAPVWPCDQ